MSTNCVTEAHSYMNYKCETPYQLLKLYYCRTLSGSKMAPLVEQEKNTGNAELMAEHPDEQYTSTETNSSENNSDVQPDEDNVNKLRNLPLHDSPPNVNGILNCAPYQSPYLNTSFHNLPKKVLGTPNAIHKPADSSMTSQSNLEFEGLYSCQKCNFVGRNDDELHEHAQNHDPYECGICGFLADQLDNLHLHLKDDHSKIPSEKWNEYILFRKRPLVESSTKKKAKKLMKSFEESIRKPRKTSCKLCNNFTGSCKLAYYVHLKEVHKKDKLLPCHMCPFIALYKHHLEYHFRNHYGSKPYVCEKCGYACVNRSMLNSHYKSHSDIYQYSCRNCTYMTKYLHSLKMHLRKYNHEPNQVLNPDGTVNKHSVIDVHGKRRGPKNKKRKIEGDQMQDDRESSKSKSSPSPPSPSFIPRPPQTILYNPQFHNNFTGNMYVRPGPSDATNYLLHSPPSIGGAIFRCSCCEFVTSSIEIYHCHLYSHVPQDRLSDGSFNPKYPGVLQNPHNFGSLGLGPNFNSESFSRNIVNQSTAAERMNINEGRSMDSANNGLHFRNSINRMNSYEAIENNRRNKEVSYNGMAMGPEAFAFNGQQYPKPRRRKENRKANLFQSNSPSQNATFTVKEEILELMNGIGSLSTENPADNVPLDLTVKQSTSPVTKSNGISSYGLVGGSIEATMNRASSASPNLGKQESKVTTQKANRRKGKAFKLNQYKLESDSVSDGAESEIEKIRALYESPFNKEAPTKTTSPTEIKRSVPRINYKPTLNTTNWNERSSLETTQADCSQYMAFQEPKLPFTESNNADLQRTRRVSDASRCSYCDMDTGSPELRDHHSSYHSKNDPFTCAKCGLRCNEKVRFNMHIISGSRINGNCINTIECKS